MSSILRATVGLADATGCGHQQRLWWCPNSSCWLLMVLYGTDLNRLRFYYNTALDFTTAIWNECAGSPYTPIYGPIKGAYGRHVNGTVRNINGNDVLHVTTLVDDGTGQYVGSHLRAVVTLGTIRFTNDGRYDVAHAFVVANPPACVSGTVAPLTTQMLPRDLIAQGGSGNIRMYQHANSDNGASWTFSSSPTTGVSTAGGGLGDVNAAVMLQASNNYFSYWEDDGAVEPNSMTLVMCVSGLVATNDVSAGFTALAGASPLDFGACGTHIYTGPIDLHCVQRTGTNTYSHRKSTGTPTHSAGPAIPAQNSIAGGGMFMTANGGGDVFLFVIDTDAANTVRYVKYTKAAAAWGAWTALETSTKVRGFLSGSRESIARGTYAGVIWTEQNGADWDIAGAVLDVSPAHAQPSIPTPSWHHQRSHGRF